MMRSLYSGVAGLKAHQTKMDVIGNNIANVNTVGFKSSSVNFTDTFYQTVSSATGPNAELATAGTNAKQIGLGSMVASITTNITEQGGPSTTNRALDIAINGESFLVVRSGSETLFSKSGALNVDEDGNLYCTTNGATVQGWLADEDGKIIKDTVKDLKVMSAENLYYEPEATGSVTVSGNIDPNDVDVDATTGKGEVMTFSFYDNLGDTYTVELNLKHKETKDGLVTYTVSVADVCDSESNSIFVKKEVQADGSIKYSQTGATFSFGGVAVATPTVSATTGDLTFAAATTWPTISFSSANGNFVKISQTRTADEYANKAFNFCITKDHKGMEKEKTTFPQYDGDSDRGGVNIFVDSLTQYSTGGTSKLSSTKGDADGFDTGNKAGNMTGVSIDDGGKIFGTYDNGLKKCLGQIAVATFSNPSGLEAAGNSLFAASLNSGEFNGVGEEVSLTGSFTVGALEMSNVDLANEFTQMITTQRGFQANSRIITTSDSMLEELVNLKR